MTNQPLVRKIRASDKSRGKKKSEKKKQAFTRMGHIKWTPRKSKPWSDFSEWAAGRYLACECCKGAMTTTHFAAGNHVMAPRSLSLGVFEMKLKLLELAPSLSSDPLLI